MKISSLRRAGAGLALSLLLGPFATHAQTGMLTDSAHWYIGGQVSLSQQVYINQDKLGFGLATAVVSAYGGYQIRPDLAVQVGLGYGRGRTPAETPSGIYNYYPQAEYITGQLTASALVRLGLGRQARRFRLEGLAGLHASYFNLRERYGHKAPEPRIVVDTRRLNGYLDLGLGGRLRLSSRLDLATDVLLNFNLQRPINFYYPIAPGGSVVLGLNYRLR